MSEQVYIIENRSSGVWTDMEIPGDITLTSDFTFDSRAYDLGESLGAVRFQFEVWNEKICELDWLRTTNISLLVVSEKFYEVARSLSNVQLQTYPVEFYEDGERFHTPTPYYVLQLGKPHDYFDREGSQFETRLNYKGEEVISHIERYELRLPQDVPPLFRLAISPWHPTFASQGFLDEARRQKLTNIGYMDVASFSPTNQLRPL
ncbi:hypothetical protein [Deinococcus aquaedulcis]|uniref:hypothetical protein n=1 Tax=Deinococcus aquaedulcis TaxID=2840455 RepID=UPI001C828BFA|nr:hypothetical protein [Deinococcus aquaedulcis]